MIIYAESVINESVADQEFSFPITTGKIEGKTLGLKISLRSDLPTSHLNFLRKEVGSIPPDLIAPVSSSAYI